MMTDEIMQLARDAHAFGDAARFGQQRACSTQFRIQATLFFSRIGLLTRDDGRDVRVTGKSKKDRVLHQRDEPSVIFTGRLAMRINRLHRRHRRERNILNDHPDEPRPERNHPWKHAGDDQHQDDRQLAFG